MIGKDLIGPSMTFLDLPWPSMTFHDIPSPTMTYYQDRVQCQDLSSPAQIYSQLTQRLVPIDSKSSFILSSMDSVGNWVILQLLIIFTGYDYSNWPPCDGISKITGFIGYDVENHFGEKLWRANWGCLQVMSRDVLHLSRPINLHYKFCLDFIDSRENWMLSLNILI